MGRFHARRTAALTAAASAAALGMAGVASGHGGWPWPWPGGGGETPRPLVELGATPERIEVVPLPCFSAAVDVTMRNPGAEAVYADAAIVGEGPLRLSRGALSSWLPAGWTQRAAVTVTAPRTAQAGEYAVRVASGAASVAVPVTVSPAPPKGPGDDLAYGERASASSTHGNFDVCGAVDGIVDSELWDTRTGWNDGTRAAFPDTYGVELAAPSTVDRVTVRTLDSRRYPAARVGLRDWDVRVRVDGAWRTVAEVRGNVAGAVESRFDAVLADAVEIVARASNDATYSRIVELEVRGGGEG